VISEQNPSSTTQIAAMRRENDFSAKILFLELGGRTKKEISPRKALEPDEWLKTDFVKENFGRVRPLSSSAASTSNQSASCLGGGH
jgi:hypothetical protein